VEILADQPEVIALAGLASVPASKIAAAFNSPEHFFEHLALPELARLSAACERMAAVQRRMVEAMETYTKYGQAILAEVAQDAD
jgi:hypothetical protein